MTGLIVENPHKYADHNCKQCQERNCPNRVHLVQSRNRNFAACYSGVALFIAAHWLVIGDNAAQTVYDGLHTQGSDERRNLQESNNAAADSTKDCTNQQNGNQTTEHRDVRQPREHTTCIVNILQQHSGQTSGQTYHTSGRQVGTFCNQTARNTTSDDESRRNVDQQVFKVSQCKKVFCKKTDKNCKKQNQNNNCVVGQKVSYTFCGDWFTFGLHLYHSHFLLIQTV